LILYHELYFCIRVLNNFITSFNIILLL